MKHTLVIVFMLLQTVAFAFDKNSALDFVYEYSADSLWGIKMPENYEYKVGMIEHDIDTLYNSWNLYEGIDSVGTRIDTILVPENNFVLFATIPDNFVINGKSPFISYFFLSKTDSSYCVIDTFGHFERFCCWDTIRKQGRLLKKDAIIDAPRTIYWMLGDIDYDLYMAEGNAIDIGVNGYTSNSVILNNDQSWSFLIDTNKDTCYLIGYERDKGEGGIFFSSTIPTPVICHKNPSEINGLSLVYSRHNGESKNVLSENRYGVYPNPVSETIYVDVEDCTLFLFSEDGVLIKKSSESNVDVSNLPSGMYLLIIAKDGISEVKRIIKK